MSHTFRPSGFNPKKPLQIIPGLGVDLPELQQARALWQQNRLDEALVIFDQAVRKYPQNFVALVDASRAFGTRFEITRAEEILDHLTKLAANNAELLHLAGQSYRMIFRPEKAIRCFERVIRMTRNIPDAQLELAVLYERRHRVDEAFVVLENCLRADPDYLEAELLKARLLRRRNDGPGADALFRKLALNEKAHPALRSQAWSEIAQKSDRDGNYDAAMSAMLKCKEILRQDEAPFRKESEAVQTLLRNLAESVTRSHIEQWTEDAKGFPPRKNVVLASFPRSGTTLLEQVLDSHPDLVSSDEREAFARDIFPAMWRTDKTPLPTLEALNAIPSGRLLAQRERYFSYMSAALNEPIGDRVHLDKNPSLTLLLPAMLRLFPETKLLIALRDPRDVIVSCFMQYLPLNTNSVCYLTLERAAERYAHDMGVWRKLREILPTPWRETRYENCVAAMETEARDTLNFLELPWDAQVLQYRDRLKTKSVSSPTYEAVSRPLYSSAIGRWKNYEKYFGASFKTLEPSLEAFGYES